MRIARFICSLFLAVGLLAIPVPSRAQVAVGISVRIGPPVLPVYVQPICPEPGFIWIPGYWAYGPDGYFWVPGTWVFPPEVGLLWTPGYWDWDDGFYIWHEGYWGPEVGFYGGVEYGFGYTGVGFYGGYWQGGTYFYNRSVTNVDVTIVRNTYNTTVVNNNTTVTRVSFHGGPGGTTARPTAQELQVANQRHVAMTSLQTQHQETARTDRALLASVNHGRPDVAASPRPGEFHGRGPLTRGPEAKPKLRTDNRDEKNSPPNREESSRPNAGDRPPSVRPSDAAPVNPKLEQRQQKELEKLRQQQDAERQKMENQHNQERQKLEQGRADRQRQDSVQRRQQQQAEQMQRKHDEQSQKLQERQQKDLQKEEQKQQQKPPKGGKP